MSGHCYDALRNEINCTIALLCFDHDDEDPQTGAHIEWLELGTYVSIGNKGTTMYPQQQSGDVHLLNDLGEQASPGANRWRFLAVEGSNGPTLRTES